MTQQLIAIKKPLFLNFCKILKTEKMMETFDDTNGF